MAENCISVRFEDDRIWTYCWDSGTPEINWEAEDVTSGLRKGYTSQARAWRTCQYFLKGMPAICQYWESTGLDGDFYCSYQDDDSTEIPSGYNSGHCDFLGRRDWCTKYETTSDDNLDEYVCIAPNPYLSGLGERAEGQEAPIMRSVRRSEIDGYNDDGSGVGLCDCYGMGRGAAGCTVVGAVSEGAGSAEIEMQLSELPIVCNYYNPSQIGFGAKEPQVLPRAADGTYKQADVDAAYEQIDQELEDRLPVSFEIYTARAILQKCQWWDKDNGSWFMMGAFGVVLEEGDPFDESGQVEFCKCTDSSAEPYNTRVEGGGFLMGNVWAVAGGPICNGARPECPCYSGKWEYLTNEKMLPGMPITANQILELRFWVADWESQKQYDDFFKSRPNYKDPETASIYTFSHWNKLNADTPEDSSMVGKKLDLCQPAPMFNKEFIPSVYVQVEEIPYPSPYVETGTTAPDQVHFPTLIRNPFFLLMDPLVITYPYYNDEDYFNQEPCESYGFSLHVKRHNKVYGDFISVVGQTTRNKTVYVLNVVKEFIPDVLDNYTSVLSLNKTSLKNKAYDELRKLINHMLQYSPDYITRTTSDDEFGYFILPSVKLDYGQTNLLLICVDYGNGTWEFRKRIVFSEWCGGIIKQTKYTHEYPDSEVGYTNTQPFSIEPTASINFEVIPLGGTSPTSYEVKHVCSTADADDWYRYYSYSIVKTVKDSFSNEIVLNWGSVGNSSLIWLQIEDINLNYIYDWKVESVVLEPSEVCDEDDNCTTVRKDAFTVYMEVVEIDQNTIPPNACILKPINDDRIRFLPSEWEMRIEYKYSELVAGNATDGREVVAGANPSYDLDRYKSPGFTVGNGVIENIDTGPVSLMAYFKDINGRLISTMATKFYVNIVSERCRNIDILYRYRAEGRRWVLNPVTGFCVDIKNDLPLPGLRTHSESPACGDHDMSGYIWFGPNWYPFNSCRQFNMYDEFTICNYCTATYVGPENDGMIGIAGVSMLGINGLVYRNDYRYCGPHKFDAWGATRGNWASSCDCGCIFYYSDAANAQVIFTGYGRIRGRINLAGHLGAYPPYGNDGRELIEKFLSNDFITHRLIYNPQIIVSEWMPTIIDNFSFYISFNAFDSDDNPEDDNYVTSAVLDQFYYMNQLNFGTLSNIGEEIDYDIRYRFGDVFEIHFEGNCCYPKPFLDPPGSVIYYYFKNQDTVWAWQEKWKDVDRNDAVVDTFYSDGDMLGKLDFVLQYEKPKYVYSLYKEEHRVICNEGAHTVTYEPPEITDGELTRYPTMSLDGVHKRPFNIIYYSYNDEQIQWLDEGGNAQVGGSAAEDNIYELTTVNNEWLHDDKIIFDSDAVETVDQAAAANREVTTSYGLFGEVKKYYNRGIIPVIPRKLLDYLPKLEEISYLSPEFSFTSKAGEIIMEAPDTIVDITIGARFVWDDDFVNISTIEQCPPCAIKKLEIVGRFGFFIAPTNICKAIKPSVSLSIVDREGSTISPRGFVVTHPEQPEKDQQLTEYTITIDLPLGPIEMTEKLAYGFSIGLENSRNSYIVIDEFKITFAEYTKGSLTETIQVWERKYLTSTAITGLDQTNLDGLDDNLSYHKDLTNAGVYFPFSQKSLDEEISAADKMRSVYCGTYHSDEQLDISYDNLHQVEAEEQQNLYNDAIGMDDIGDELLYYGVTPPKIEAFLKAIDIYGVSVPSWALKSDKLIWEKHYRTKQFKQYEYWRPGGHYYTWSSSFVRAKCMLFGPAHNIYSGSYIHVDHVGVGTPLEVDASKPIDPGNSYYSLRFYVQVAKYNRFLIMSGIEPDGGFDLVTQANIFN